MKFKRGFTFIELLVVIAIMGILTIITVSQFQTARRKARDVQRKADISSLSKALQMYFTDYGEFPSASDSEDPIDINGIFGTGGEFADGAGYVYMKVVPEENSLNPPSIPQYCYVVSSDQKMFALYTVLENDQDSDYNKNNGGNPYEGCGNEYNFAIFSPNAEYSDF